MLFNCWPFGFYIRASCKKACNDFRYYVLGLKKEHDILSWARNDVRRVVERKKLEKKDEK